MTSLSPPPLSLYVHIPWCVQKCPYCDFNSHAQKGEIPETQYIDALLEDLKTDIEKYQLIQAPRLLHSIFIGGGTPSLISPSEIGRLLQGIEALLPFEGNIEITMEANPGTIEAERFAQFQTQGVNRISIGVQSFEEEKLQALGRIHGQQEAVNAAKLAHKIGLNSFNLDLMHGLPNQTQSQALVDLDKAIELNPYHLSWYQLTIEPNTLFYSKPPILPDDDDLWDIFEQGHQRLTDAGYVQYEISGYSKPGYQCRHNLNYWHFGDYLGIGCGSHGKLSFADGRIVRTTKVKHPRGYLAAYQNLVKSYLDTETLVEAEDRPFEYFMNRFRLIEPCPKTEFVERTGLALSVIETPIQTAIEQGYLTETESHWHITQKGKLFFNDLVELFVEEE
ncbi:radical SAM family heme chaperone HemW [Vibrio rumoiensis]|uniref:radical SAM family heme chaperone HemW n=1 Tax=Vibrio rumoiensis TaxID=76258 RepID=UPI003AA82923